MLREYRHDSHSPHGNPSETYNSVKWTNGRRTGPSSVPHIGAYFQWSGVNGENPTKLFLQGRSRKWPLNGNPREFCGSDLESSSLRRSKQSDYGRLSWLSDSWIPVSLRHMTITRSVCVRTHCKPTLHSRALIELSRPGLTFHLTPMPNTIRGFVPGETLR